MLQGHIDLGIIPSNVDGGGCSFAPGQRVLGLLPDYSKPLLCSDQYLDIGDLECSTRCMNYEERLCRIKDIAHDLRLQPPPPSLTRCLKVYIVRICTISSVYKEFHSMYSDAYMLAIRRLDLQTP
ncbi:hypothetical protein BDP27DRAFT_366012 [Rhodocollybia butyracea]|uniref:Uncharacterized protein n=1 Tax=Rhodocollybia butyracea TaxID=206335 RepID=A0A9P5PCB2_9AGAR|nr:hypothetical protein BDP27DRAFT_366012 [Rhodocollybia butyracea]